MVTNLPVGLKLSSTNVSETGPTNPVEPGFDGMHDRTTLLCLEGITLHVCPRGA